MLSASASHRRVEPSTSVNTNVITPEGAGTPAECHNKPPSTSNIQDDPDSRSEARRRRPRGLRWRLWIDVVLGARSLRLLERRERLLGPRRGFSLPPGGSEQSVPNSRWSWPAGVPSLRWWGRRRPGRLYKK